MKLSHDKILGASSAIISVCVLSLIFFTMYPTKAIESEDKKQIGRTELYAKGIARPLGMVLDKDGRLFVQSDMDGTISLISRDGISMDYTYVDEYYDYGMDIDENNNFVLASKQQVTVIDNSGNIVRNIEGFGHAYDVARGPGGVIFVSDSRANSIYSITPEGKTSLLLEFKGFRSEKSLNVTGICVDKDFKNIFAVNMYNGNLYKISLNDRYEAESYDIFASYLPQPNFIDIDEHGNMYVSCVGDNSVIRVNQNSIKEYIDTKGKLISPSGIEVISEDNGSVVYVASTDNNGIYKISIESKNITRE